MQRLVLCAAAFLACCNLLTEPKKDDPSSASMKLLWEIPYEFVGTAVIASPLLFGDSLVVMSAGKEVFVVDQLTGSIRWKAFVDVNTNIQTDEFRKDDVRLFATHVEDMRAWSINNGTVSWVTVLPERRAFAEASIAYSGDRLYVGGFLNAYCLDAQSGALVWTKKLQSRGLLTQATVFAGEVILGGDYGVDDANGVLKTVIGKLYWLNPLNGDTIRSVTMQGDGGPRAFITDSGRVFGGTHFPFSSASFEAFDAYTGERKWSFYTPNEGWDYSYAIVAGDMVIANAGPYHVCAFNKYTGQLLWRTFVVEDANAGKLYYYDGYVYHPHGIRIRILDPQTGKVVYTLNGANDNNLYTMTVGNGRVFVQGFPYLQCYETYKP